MELASDWYVRYANKRSNCFPITYEDMVEKSSRLREMFCFLGVDYDEEMVDRVLAVQHSYKTTDEHFSADN
jgi:hypothetical protein